jgi:hypothetical protein
MLAKHIQERGGFESVGTILGGLKEMVWGKMLLQPLYELYNNRDYFGREVFDHNAPGYKQLEQAAQHIFLEQALPMSFTSAERATGATGNVLQRIGTTLSTPEGLLSYAGFGPCGRRRRRSGSATGALLPARLRRAVQTDAIRYHDRIQVAVGQGNPVKAGTDRG